MYLKTLYDFLEINSDIKFSTVWFDYLCTFGGNKDVRPKEDIALLFNNRMLENNSIFAITLTSMRQKEEYENQMISQAKKFILKTAKANNYDLIEDWHIKYDNSMYFVIYEVCLNN